MFGNGADGKPDPNRYFRLSRAHLVVPNLEARRLFWDFWILGDATREFLEDIGKNIKQQIFVPKL